MLFLPRMKSNYFSQNGQDRYLDRRIFKKKEGGFFVDIGAHNGITFSNTYFFEKHRNWKGICIEPIPEVFAELDANRNCIKVNGCIAKTVGTASFLRVKGEVVDTEMLSGLVAEYDDRHLARIDRELKEYGGTKEEIQVQCFHLNELLEQHQVSEVDYISIDTEGNELAILESIDYSACKINVLSVENNYNTPAIREFMEYKGYIMVKKLEVDEIYMPKADVGLWKQVFRSV